MKITKGLLLFGLVAGASSCFDPPEFDDIPKIDFEDLYFEDIADDNEMDAIVLSLKFQDGDGDLGLESDAEINPRHFSTPYQSSFYYLENGGELIPVSTYIGITDEDAPRFFDPILDLGSNQNGILATLRTRDKPEFADEDLPPYTFPQRCLAYTSGDIYLLGDDIRVVDNTFPNVVEVAGFDPPLYKVTDIFYTQKNEDSQNIQVDWLVKRTIVTPDSTYAVYEEFKWEEQNLTGCASSFDARFQVVSQSENPVEGILRYSMRSVGFVTLFFNRTLRLRVQIKDRALHRSNIIETEDFTLSQIRK